MKESRCSKCHDVQVQGLTISISYTPELARLAHQKKGNEGEKRTKESQKRHASIKSYTPTCLQTAP